VRAWNKVGQGHGVYQNASLKAWEAGSKENTQGSALVNFITFFSPDMVEMRITVLSKVPFFV
jgi:hypothetical protein